MRIGLLTTSFPRDTDDLAGCFVRGFAEALAHRGHVVEVLAPEPDRGGPPVSSHPNVALRWVPYLRPRALQRTFYGAGVPDNVRRDPLAWLGLGPFVLALDRAIARRESRWDAIVSHWALPCALLAQRHAKGRPHLAVMHSADVHLLEHAPGRRSLADRIASARLWFVSQNLKTRFFACMSPSLRAEAETRSFVSPMGIEPPPLDTYDRPTLRARLDVDRFTVASMSRLVSIKGIDLAISAMAGRSDWELRIAGDGPERAALEQRAREANAPVRFLGALRGTAKWDFLRSADVFVSSSRPLPSGRTEGAPTGVIEALAAGLPVVASTTGGLPTLVSHERTGLLVPPGSPKALHDGFARLAADDMLRSRLSLAAKHEGRELVWPKLAPLVEAMLTRASATRI